MKLSIPLVGMHFRPPAAQVLAALPLGTTVQLIPEPSNEYDRNAVRVVVDLHEVGYKTAVLEAMLTGTGFTLAEVASQPLQLGYLAATGGKPAQGGPGNVEALLMMSALEMDAETALPPFQGKLSCLPDGRPSVEITNEPR